jgi:hypothetical protein
LDSESPIGGLGVEAGGLEWILLVCWGCSLHIAASPGHRALLGRRDTIISGFPGLRWAVENAFDVVENFFSTNHIYYIKAAKLQPSP